MGFLLRLLANMAALAVATWIFSGISLSGSDTDLARCSPCWWWP